jgi:gamma-glutamyl phosphate reductase
VKSGNAVLLRGGKEAIESNALIAAVLAKALEKTGRAAGRDPVRRRHRPRRGGQPCSSRTS